MDYEWWIRSYKDKTKSRKNDDSLSLITITKMEKAFTIFPTKTNFTQLHNSWTLADL